VAGSPDLAKVRDRRSPLLHSFGDLRSRPVTTGMLQSTDGNTDILKVLNELPPVLVQT
jgi:hypothetical protein